MIRPVVLTVRPWMLAALALSPLAAASASRAQGRVRDHRPSVSQETAATAPAERLVRLDFDNAPLDRVLRSISQQSRLDITYFDNTIAGRKVTVHAESIAVYSALQLVLKGTDLKVNILPSGNVSIVGATDARGAEGGVDGAVTDTVGGGPLAGARVTILGTSLAAETDKNGRFRFASVPPGTYVIRVTRLGFLAKQVSVVVRDGGTVSVAVRLHAVATRLTEVVTTTTGQQERLKVGNDVATINADSLVQNTLVRNMSDLLQGHAAGVQVTSTSGAVGAPSKIRVRGVTSPQLNNDPIVVVDGVRVNAQTTVNTLSYFGSQLPASQVNTGSPTIGRPSTSITTGTPAPSPLDQIDPNMIESIDVLKGPTATALYGPDASTGVIVVKTKAGRPGPWRYHVGGDYGWLLSNRDNPLYYAGWGRTLGGTGASQPGCNLVTSRPTDPSQSNGGCVLDSVTAFNALNDPQMTNQGTGYSRSFVTDASGGGSTVRGFIQADYADAIGQLQLSKVEQRRLNRLWTTPVPSWIKRPNAQINTHVTSRVDAQFTPNFDIAATAAGTYQTTRNDGTGISTLTNIYGPGDTLAFTPAENLRGRANTSTKRGTGSSNARLQPFSWLVLTGAAGLDYSLRDDQTLTRSQDCTTQINTSGCSSSHTATHTEVLSPSFTTGATFTYNLTSWLGAHTAFGEQFSRTQSYVMSIGASSLAFGQDLITGATTISTPTESQDQSASAGWYAEQQLAFNDRLFVTAALRRDASSSFGGNIQSPTFPKYGASWVLSNESFFPKQDVFTQLRLRASYGESGKQGAQTDVLRNYTIGTGTAGGVNVPVIVFSGLGNGALEPQRDREWEGGFDASFYNDRATFTVTWYNKQSKNAIITVNVPPSPGVVIPLQAANIGNIRNVGTELQMSLRPIDSRLLTWDFNMTASANSNKLVRSNALLNLPSGNANTRNIPGYPLFGLWERPILSYGDYNHNGILEGNEIVFGDSLVFVGSTDPKGSYNYANTFSFLHGKLSVSSLISQVNGLATQLSLSATRGRVDPTAPLAEQAAALQAYGTSTYLNGAGGYMGTVSYVNFAELSMAYTLPEYLTRRLHGRSMQVMVAARNLKLWTNYRGADPMTNTSNVGGDNSADNGTGLAQPRNWVLRFNLQL